jgi:hypothetical protein
MLSAVLRSETAVTISIQIMKAFVAMRHFVQENALLSKRRKGVAAKICCKRIIKQLALDLEKHNAQYASIELVPFDDAHDRFLILDGKTVYHIGASLKDLGKKWFAFSEIEKDAIGIIERLPK